MNPVLDSRLELHLLGAFALGGGLRLPTRKGEALLAYLAMPAGRPHRRDLLLGLFWGERGEKQARHSLSQTLFSVRKALADGGYPGECIIVDGDSVMLDAAGSTVDVAEFERLGTEGGTEAITRAAQLYRGDLLQGMSLREIAFEHWLAAERSRLREAAVSVFARLVGLHEHAGRLDQAVQAAARLLAIDPLQESAHRDLMRLYMAQGRPAAALRQYEECARILGRDLGIEPERETRQLRADITRRRSLHQAPTPSPPLVAEVEPEPPPVVAPTYGERKTVTVLCAEIGASFDLEDEIDPEHAAERLEPGLKTLTEAVQRHGGRVVQARNDGLMALFGAPLAMEDHAARACWTALAMREALAVGGTGLDLRASLHAGEVVLRDGCLDGRSCDVFGPVVQLCQRVGALLPAGTLAVTGEVARRASGYVRLQPLGRFLVAGARAGVEMFALTGTTAARTRWDVQVAGELTPFVGRQAQLALLDDARRRTALGRGEAVAVVGDAGVGKSRLLHNLLRRTALADWTVMMAGATAHETGAMLPIRRLLRDWLDLGRAESSGDETAALRDALCALDPALLAVLAPLACLLDLPASQAEWRQAGPAQRRRATIEALTALLVAQARRRPLTLVFEDLHWADAETAEVLDELVRALPAAPILFIVTYRPEYRDPWAARSDYTLCRLAPLDAARASQLVEVLLGAEPALTPLKEQLATLSGGNPLFIEECVRSLAEAGVLAGEPGRHRLAGPGEVAVPATVRDVIAARLDRLPATAKQVLQTAAVLGRTVPLPLVEAIAGLQPEALRGALSELQRVELLYQTAFFPRAEFAFKHALIRDVAYSALPRPRRTALHAEAAGALESMANGQDLDLLAHHCEAGERWDKAARYLLQAALKAKAEYGYGRAADLAGRARAAAERAGAGEFRVDALTLLGDLDSLRGDLAEANRHYEEALTLEGEGQRRRLLANRRHRVGSIVRDGTRIAYYEHGSGSQTLLFVNPIVYGLPIFQPLIEELCQSFRIVTLDPRGTGASDPLTRPCRMREHVADTRAVIEAIGGGPVVGVGISRGSNLLVRLAHDNPGMIDRLVLVGAPVDDMGPGSRFPRVNADNIAALLARGDIQAVTREMTRGIFSEPGTEDIAAIFAKSCLEMPRETFLSFFDRDADYDIDPLLPGLRVPALVLFGAEDRRVPVVAGEYIARRVPNARLHLLAGRGHLPLFTATAEFCDVLRRFVRAS